MPEKRVLIVVSDRDLGNLLERGILKPAGYHVSLVNNIRDADLYLAQTLPSLIVVAQQLVDGDGLDLVRMIRKRHPQLPVISILSNASRENILEAMQCNVTQCLWAPMTKDDVLQAVESAFDYGRRLTEWAKLLTKRDTDSLRRRLDVLELLGEVGRSVTASLDIDHVLSSVVDAAVNLTEAEEGSLLLIDELSGELYMRAAKNFQDEFVRTFRLPIDDTLAGQVIQSGEAAEINADTPQKIKTSYLVRRLIYVPLKVHGRVIGVLGVDNRQSPTDFSELHLTLLNALADYAAIAIENARLYHSSEIERQKLETILTNVEDGVIVVGSDRKVLLVNHTARDAFRIGTRNVEGKTIEAVFQGSPVLELLQGHFGDSNYRDEIKLEDGRYFNAVLSSIDNVGTVVAMQDITHLKELDRIKTDFVNTVSHDLRSPLTAILGYVELIERVGEVNKQQRDFIKRVQISVRSIADLINDLLDLGRIESGFDSRKDVVVITPLIREVIENQRNQIDAKSQHLTVSLAEDVPGIFGDKIRLKQMIDNILGNAIKYTPYGGMIQLLTQVEKDQLILRITDSGRGIPPADQPYIFDKFYRASNITSDIPGTGLGLAIVKSIVESHRGRIWVDSALGKGTTFTVVLPVYKGDTASD